MRRPAPTWETDYRHDRRKHRHRCKCCKRVIDAGERVVMARAAGRKTVAMHSECADRKWIADAPETGRDIMAQWGLAGLKKAGWHVPELETHFG